MRYLIPLLFLFGACQVPNQQAADGDTQAVAILTSDVIVDETCAIQTDCEASDADCDKMDATDCPMAGAAECSMEGNTNCAKEDCAEGSACCKQPECEEE